MKFTTFYFSGTGNTKWVVEEFDKIVINTLNDSEIISIESIDNNNFSFLIEKIKNSDFIGFANPIYGGNIPPIMLTFIKNLIKMVENENIAIKPVYIINTFAYVNGFGPFCAKKLFKKSCFKIISYINIRLGNNISLPNFRVKLTDKAILNKRKNIAIENLISSVDLILKGKKKISGIGPYLIPNILIRKKSIIAIKNNYNVLSINCDTCSRCMKCVNSCPTKSIKYENNSFSFLSSCTACMRCYNNCHSYSILFQGKYVDPDLYERYHGI